MFTDEDLRSSADAFFSAELFSLLDANSYALESIKRCPDTSGIKELVEGLCNFYSWMEGRHHKTVRISTLKGLNAASQLLGLDAINSFLTKRISASPGAPITAQGVLDCEDHYIRSTWTQIISSLTKAKKMLDKSGWDDQEVKKHSFLPKDSRTRLGWSVDEYLRARIARCQNQPERMQFWTNSSGGFSSGSMALNSLINQSPMLSEKADSIFILCALSAKYHIMQIFYRHTSDPVSPNEHERIYAIFTFIKSISKYFPHYLTVDGNDYSLLFRCNSHLRRGMTKFHQGVDPFYQRQFPQAFSMAFNEYERSSQLVKLLDDGSLGNLYKHLIPIMSSFFKGELYRHDCSYSNAREHYYDGARICERLFPTPAGTATILAPVMPEIANALKYSYARAKALANLGKIYFELGEFRRALKWLFRALGALPELTHDTNRMAFVALVGRLITRLHNDKNEPLVAKDDLDLLKLLGEIPIVIDSILISSPNNTSRIYCLCSKIVNTIAMILYQMRFVSDEAIDQIPSPHLHNPLAFTWLCLALKLDPNNAQAIHNANSFQKNWHYQFNTKGTPSLPPDLQKCIKKTDPSSVIQSFDRDRDLSPMDRWNRQISASIIGGTKHRANILDAFFAYTDNFSKRNFELLRYLCRERTIDNLQTDKDAVYLKTIRRWSSFTPSLPRPQALSKRGGGYFIITQSKEKDGTGFKRKGIVIDPGFDFIRNLYIEGHSLHDIDAIIVTHNHIDHTADIDPCLSLINYLSHLSDKKPIDLMMNQGVAQRYSFYLTKSKSKHEIVKRLHVLAPDVELDCRDDYGLKISTLRTKHRELGANDYGLGLIFDFNDSNGIMSIGFTGDTSRSVLDNPRWIEAFKRCQIIVANIGTVPFPELMSLSHPHHRGSEVIQLVWNLLTKILELPLTEKSYHPNQLAQLRAILWSLWFNPEDEMLEPPTPEEAEMKILHWHKIFLLCCFLFGRYEKVPDFLLGLGQVRELRNKGLAIDERRNDKQQSEYLQYLYKKIKVEVDPAGEHLFLGGIKLLLEKLSTKCMLHSLVISEFREELGSFRRLIADYLNQPENALIKGMMAHTADTDYAMRLKSTKPGKSPDVSIRCSLCKLSNDCFAEDSYHDQNKIREVCVKGEDDAMYYFCPRHTPGFANQFFMEKLECYKPFDKEFRY
jgi:hypothetical protein